MPTVRSTVQGSIWVSLAEGLALPTGLVTAMLLTRSLGATSYGLFTLAASFIAWIQWSVATFFSRPTVKLVGGAADWQSVASSILRTCLITGLCVAGIIVATAPWIAALLHEPVLADYLRLLSIDIVLFIMAHAYRSVLIGMGNFRRRALAGGAKWVARMVLICVLVLSGFGIQGAIWGSIGASLVELVLAAWRTGVSLWRPSSVSPAALWRLAAPLGIAALSLRLFDRLDLFLLKFLGASAADAGIYGAAQNLTIVANIVTVSASPLLLSTMTRALREGDRPTAEATARTFMRLLLMALPGAFLAAGCSGEVVRIIFGPGFLGAGPLLAILIFAAFALMWFSLMTAVLVAEDMHHWIVVMSASMIPAAAVVHLVVIPRWGSAGAASGTTAIATLAALVSSITVWRVSRLSPPFETLWRSMAVGGILITAGWTWQAQGGWIWMKLATLVLAAPFLLAALGEFRRVELRAAWEMLRG
jgi:O-antigen/teichoic acid export membrane protein